MAAPHRSLWLAVDSDGSVFDAMDPKHREAFAPALISVWGLHATAEIARDLFLEINLRSRARGANRFVALALFFQQLAVRVPPSRLTVLPSLDRFLAWVASGMPLSETSLAAALALSPGDGGLERALAWSQEVNHRVRLLPRPKAFAGAAEALRAAANCARIAVVSSGHGPTIRAEWRHAGLETLADEFFTQENGTKADLLRALVARTGDPRGVLMIGDAPVDLEAAQTAAVPFFPIVPGSETSSWRELARDVLPAFLAGDYGAQRAAPALAAFASALGLTAPVPASL